LATLAASFWPHGDEKAAVEIVGPPARGVRGLAAADPSSPLGADLPPLGEKLERPQAAQKMENLFAITSWIPPAPKPAPGPPSAPSPPPFPYTIVGGLADSSMTTVVFTGQNQYFVAGVGDVFADRYRLDEIQPDSITVTYLPLGQKQVLPVGSPN
jgi:hypothetical protein